MKKELIYYISGGVAVVIILIAIYKKRRKIISFMLNKEQEYFINDLHESGKKKITDFIAKTQARGYRVIITTGYRSFEKQVELKKENSKNASPGLSMHNYGLAIDINLQRGTELWRKRDTKEKWIQTGIPQMAKNMGLFWGGDFKTYHDPVHFEIDMDGAKLLAQAKKQFGNDPNKIQGNKVLIT